MSNEVVPPADPRAVHLALLSVARAHNADFNAILIQYAIERLLHRVSCSSEAPRFVLKGAMLFRVWFGMLHRPTKDVDFLGTGDASPASVAKAFRAIVCTAVTEDGLRFDPKSIAAIEIRGEQAYGGVNVVLTAHLGQIPITVRIDVGFGDVVTPRVESRFLPTMLGHEVARIQTYPPETAVSEKVEAMCRFGIANSRMKDYYDIVSIGRRFEFDGRQLSAAILATFRRRGTHLPSGVPTGLSLEFAEDVEKQRQWAAFLSRNQIRDAPAPLVDSVGMIRAFVLPACAAAVGSGGPPGVWTPSSGWRAIAD
ncbi:MAG: nucleotidyl transferase AbiEii/AbiGii toxin family protein [Phycisphaerales bacterium]|nr:nucleotidyl transferase AbiEii/AbiGii toxin family protein [Phycisphaerales bacterium]